MVGRWESPNRRNAHNSFCGHFNCNWNNSQAGSCLFQVCVTVLPFLLWLSHLNCFCILMQTLYVLGSYFVLTFSFPPLLLSVFRFVTTQTVKTWIAKAPSTCVSHVTHATIQRIQTTCTLTGTPDLTCNLKVDLHDFFIWYPSLSRMTLQDDAAGHRCVNVKDSELLLLSK